MTIRDVVNENEEELRKLADKGDYRGLRKWGTSHGYDSQAGFGNYKKALAEAGMDYEGLRASTWAKEESELRGQVTHQVELYGDYRHSTGRFCLTDEEGNPLWYGKEFEAKADQATGEKDVVGKAVWLSQQIARVIEAPAVELRLHVSSETLAKDSKSLAGVARRGKVALRLVSEQSGGNRASFHTQPSNGFLAHPKGEELKKLARAATAGEVVREEKDIASLEEEVTRIHRERVAREQGRGR
jgi:hypothetical protein